MCLKKANPVREDKCTMHTSDIQCTDVRGQYRDVRGGSTKTMTHKNNKIMSHGAFSHCHYSSAENLPASNVHDE